MEIKKVVTFLGLETRDVKRGKDGKMCHIVECYIRDDKAEILKLSCSMKEPAAREMFDSKGMATIELHTSGYRVLAQVIDFTPADEKERAGIDDDD